MSSPAASAYCGGLAFSLGNPVHQLQEGHRAVIGHYRPRETPGISQ